MKPMPYHTFNEWPAFLVLAALFAVGSAQAFVSGYEMQDAAFMAVVGGGWAVVALLLAGLAIQTRRYKLERAPIIAADRLRCSEAARATTREE